MKTTLIAISIAIGALLLPLRLSGANVTMAQVLLPFSSDEDDVLQNEHGRRLAGWSRNGMSVNRSDVDAANKTNHIQVDTIQSEQTNNLRVQSKSKANPQEFIINGVVRDFDGSPMEGVRVATGLNDPVSTSDFTDASGMYTLTVPAGTFNIRPSKFFGVMDPPAQTVTVPPNQTNVDFIFPERFTISGTVRDFDGTPMENAFVIVSGPVVEPESTAADGTYAIEVISGTYRVSVNNGTFPAPAPVTINVPPDQTNVNFSFPERPAARLAVEQWTNMECIEASGGTARFTGTIYNPSTEVTGRNIRLWVDGFEGLTATVTPNAITEAPNGQRFDVAVVADIPPGFVPDTYQGTLYVQGDNTYFLSLALTFAVGFPCGGGHLVLDGIDAFADTVDHPELDIDSENGDSLTLEGWFAVSATKPSAARVEVISCKWGSYCLYIQRWIRDSDFLFLRLWSEPSRSHSWGSSITTHIPLGWHHVAGEFDNAQDEVRLYYDGELKMTRAFTNSINISNNPVVVGSLPNAENPFEGIIDEVRISNVARYIDDSYTVPKSPFTCDANTLALWHFDDGVDSVIFPDSCGEDNRLFGRKDAHSNGPNCTYALSPKNELFTFEKGTGTVNVTTLGNCMWTVESQVDWISIASDHSVSSSGSVTYSVAANSSSITRTGTLLVATHPFTVTQSGIDCTYTIAPTSQNFDADEHTGRINVNSPTSCDWTAESQVDWVTIVSGANGSGNGSVEFSLDTNSNPITRTGTLLVATHPVTVTQSGIDCTYAITPTSQNFDVGKDAGRVSVTTLMGCNWTAESQANWISIDSGAKSSGNGLVEYSVATNTSTKSRTGTLIIAGHTVTVNQAGVVSDESPQIFLPLVSNNP